MQNKSGDILFQLLKCLKERRLQEAKQLIDGILTNRDQKSIKYLQSVDLNMSMKQLDLQLQNDHYYRLNESAKEIFTGYIEFLKNLHKYYLEREKAGPDIKKYFKEFFQSSQCLLEQDTKGLFYYVTRQIIKEYNRIIKQLKSHAKDSEAVKRASQASKSLENETGQIIDLLFREVNTKHALEFKLMLANQQMKVYFMNFKFDRAAQCDKVPNEKQLLDISPKQDLITYFYYKGRLLIFSSKFHEASQNLQQVLNFCPVQTQKGIKTAKQVLKYLIPVNLFLGKYPTQQLLDQFKLNEYADICSSIKNGNIKKLQESIDVNRGLWIKRSLLILMDQLKVLCYRNLCRKVWLINNKQKKIALDQFLKAFKFSHPENQEPSYPEVCCIIANLIFLNLLKGKIYQNNEANVRALTLSDNPFSQNQPQDINWQN